MELTRCNAMQRPQPWPCLFVWVGFTRAHMRIVVTLCRYWTEPEPLPSMPAQHAFMSASKPPFEAAYAPCYAASSRVAGVVAPDPAASLQAARVAVLHSNGYSGFTHGLAQQVGDTGLPAKFNILLADHVFPLKFSALQQETCYHNSTPLLIHL